MVYYKPIIFKHSWNFIAHVEEKSNIRCAEKTRRPYGRVIFKEIDNGSVKIKAVVFSDYLEELFLPLKVICLDS